MGTALYRRVLESPFISEPEKERLADIHKQLDPLDLKDRINYKLKKIFELNKKLQIQMSTALFN